MNSARKSLRILFVENSPEDIAVTLHELERGGFEPTFVKIETSDEMRAALTKEWDIVLCDHALPQFNSTEALRLFTESGLQIPFIIISGTIDENSVADAMRAGANDYLNKNRLARLVPTVERELRQMQLRRDHRNAEEAIKRSTELRRVAFASLMQKLNLTTTPKAAARIILGSADELLGWDACSFDLYSSDPPKLYPILNLDTVDGQRMEVCASYGDHPPNGFKTSVLKEGGKLILRNEPSNNEEKLTPFGDIASFRFAHFCSGPKWLNDTGILSIQSYKKNAYRHEDVEVLQSLADYCGGALERIAAQEAQTQLMAALEAQHKRLDDLLANVPGVVWEVWSAPAPQRKNFINQHILKHCLVTPLTNGSASQISGSPLCIRKTKIARLKWFGNYCARRTRH